MPLAASDRESIAFKPEATFGTVAGTGNYYALRMNSEALKYDLTTKKSEEIVDDRTVRDLILVDASASGPVPCEFSYGEYDWLIQALLATTISNVVGTNGSHVATGTVTISATGVTLATGAPFASCESGQWIRVSNASSSGNNKLVQITGILGTGTGFSVASGTFTAETGTGVITFQGARFKNGSTLRTFSIERKNADLNGGTGLYECFRGMAVDKWSLSFQPGSILGQQYEFIGKDSLPMSTGRALPGTGVSSLTNSILNSVDSVSNIYEGGSLLTSTYVRQMTLNVMNNMEPVKAVGNLGAVDLRLGKFNAQLSLQLYLDSETYYNKFRNNTSTSFSVRLTDQAGNAYVITLPRADYSSAERPNPGRNQMIILNAQIEALRDPTTGLAFVIDRCGAAVTPWA